MTYSMLVKIHFLMLLLIQQAPPPPDLQGRAGPTPVGDVVPLDTNLWILLAVAIALIGYVAVFKFKKVA